MTFRLSLNSIWRRILKFFGKKYPPYTIRMKEVYGHMIVGNKPILVSKEK